MTTPDSPIAKSSVTVTICTIPRPVECARAIAAVNSACLPLGISRRLIINDASAPPPTADLSNWDIVRAPMKGIDQARNMAVDLDVLTTEFIAFVDDDDEVEPDWLQRLLVCQAENNADIVFGYWRNAGQPLEPYTYHDFFGLRMPARVGSCNVLISRRALNLVGRPPFRFPVPGRPRAEDLDFFIRSIKNGATWAACPESLIVRHFGPRGWIGGHCKRYYGYGLDNYALLQHHNTEKIRATNKYAKKRIRKTLRRILFKMPVIWYPGVFAKAVKDAKMLSLVLGIRAAHRTFKRQDKEPDNHLNGSTEQAASITIALCTLPPAPELGRALAAVERADLPPGTRRLLVINHPTATIDAPGLDAWTVIREPQKGLHHARNRAVSPEVLQTQFVAFIDDDDEVHPDWLTELLATQSKTGADIVFGYWQNAGQPLEPYTYGDIFGHRLPNRMGGGNMLISRGALLFAGDPVFRHDTPGPQPAEDTEFFLRAIQGGAIWTACPESLITRHFIGDRDRLSKHCHRYRTYGFNGYHLVQRYAPENLSRLVQWAEKRLNQTTWRHLLRHLFWPPKRNMYAAYLRFHKDANYCRGVQDAVAYNNGRKDISL